MLGPLLRLFSPGPIKDEGAKHVAVYEPCRCGANRWRVHFKHEVYSCKECGAMYYVGGVTNPVVRWVQAAGQSEGVERPVCDSVPAEGGRHG